MREIPMLDITQEDSNNKMIEIIIDGTITTDAMTKLSSRVEELANDWGTINILERYITIDKIYPSVVFEDLKLYFKLRKKFNKVAVVTEKTWVTTLTKIFSPFFRVEVQTFSVDEISTARRWLVN